MLAIIRRSLPLYFSHLGTFSFYLVMESAIRHRAVIASALLAPVWLASSVLWSERRESYAFLRLLPVRERDVVSAKLILGLGATLFYWLWISLWTLVSLGFSPRFLSFFSLVNLISSASLVLVALCYLGIWRFGARAMTAPIVGFLVIGILAVIAKILRQVPHWPTVSVPVQIAAAAAAAATCLLVARAAPRIKRGSESHLDPG